MKPHYGPAIADFRDGLLAWNMWGRIGWSAAKRRYRRTVIGPFWSTLSLGIFVVVLGLLWSALWKQDPKAYLPYLTAGMITWIMFSSIVSDGTGVFVISENLIKQLRFPYTLLGCALVWRNMITFAHNLIIYIPVFFITGMPLSWASLLVVPGLALFALNSIWIAMVTGLACARYRDIQQIVSSFLQIAMFVTPVFWSPSQLTGRMAQIVQFNVLYHLMDVVRGPLLGQTPSMLTWIVATATAIFGWGLMLVLFAMFRRRLPYWL